MMPQLKAIATDEQTIAQRELDKHVEAQANTIAPDTASRSFDGLAQSTQNILTHALVLAQQKEHLSRTEYRKLLNEYGWKNEDKRYLKVAAAFKQCSHADLSQIEPATVFRLANNPKKYQSVINQLLYCEIITQQTVRELIAEQRQPKKPKSEKASIWRRTKNGGRYCQIPPIHEENEQTGTTLQKMVDEEGLTVQQIIAEAIALRQAYIEGRLVYVEPVTSGDSEEDSTSSINGICPLGRSEAIADGENIEFESNFQEEELPESSCTFESEPEKDDSPFLDKTELSPVEVLIETFKTATSWTEIRDSLIEYGDCKHLAWHALTQEDREKVLQLMPPGVKKLSEAKKAKLIVEFQEKSDGIYWVQPQELCVPRIISESRLDDFLAQLHQNPY
ncbi:hypothetical protein NUACC21_43100 [Scytonema sp. NUACC21]